MIWMIFYQLLQFNLQVSPQCNAGFSLLPRIYGVQEHLATFGDCHEINERSSLRIRPPITTNKDPFLLSCGPDGLHQPLYVRFFTLQESGPQRVVAERFVAGYWII